MEKLFLLQKVVLSESKIRIGQQLASVFLF